MDIAARVRLPLLLLRVGVFKNLLGAAELVLIVMFVTGTAKRFSYGAVLALHAVSTASSYRQYMAAFNNLLFFAAWPMLAACIALYLPRDLDTLWTVRR